MSKQELETAQALRDIERENKNCKAAVVLAKEWIAEKDAEIERLNGLVALQKKDMKVAMDENAKLRAALILHGVHEAGCAKWDKMDCGQLFVRHDWPCSCGLEAALKETDDELL
jgi:hypothetical protein